MTRSVYSNAPEVGRFSEDAEELATATSTGVGLGVAVGFGVIDGLGVAVAKGAVVALVAVVCSTPQPHVCEVGQAGLTHRSASHTNPAAQSLSVKQLARQKADAPLVVGVLVTDAIAVGAGVTVAVAAVIVPEVDAVTLAAETGNEASVVDAIASSPPPDGRILEFC
jgi:hypothetical protein